MYDGYDGCTGYAAVDRMAYVIGTFKTMELTLTLTLKHATYLPK